MFSWKERHNLYLDIVCTTLHILDPFLDPKHTFFHSLTLLFSTRGNLVVLPLRVNSPNHIRSTRSSTHHLYYTPDPDHKQRVSASSLSSSWLCDIHLLGNFVRVFIVGVVVKISTTTSVYCILYSGTNEFCSVDKAIENPSTGIPQLEERADAAASM